MPTDAIRMLMRTLRVRDVSYVAAMNETITDEKCVLV